MERCATCLHWTDPDAWDVEAGGFRLCAAVKRKSDVDDEIPEALQGEQYFTKSASYLAAAEKVFAKAMAVVDDGRTRHGDLMTGPNFGCVLHAPK